MQYDYETQVSTAQYEYIKVCGSAQSIEDVVEVNRALVQEVRGGEGISDTEFNDFLDKYLSNDLRGGLETYEKMNKEQKIIVQAIKRSKARIKRNLA